ncbi:MAG: DedA family protein [Terriglobales bacterium]
MTHHVVNFLRAFIADYGYWAVALALLSESSGLPVPGEITLLLASFLAYHEHRLHLGWIIIIATAATTIGGDLGFALGHYGGRPLLDRYQSIFRISPAIMKRGEQMFARYGEVAVFFARFIFGLRVFAGPLAGVLRMRWRAFAIFNFLGAMVWVTFIAGAGYLFGQHWHTLLQTVQRFNTAVLLIAGVAILFLWWKYRRQSAPES